MTTTLKKYVIERLSEPSTWRGIVLLVTAMGVPVNPELMEPIIATGLAITGVIGVISKDK